MKFNLNVTSLRKPIKFPKTYTQFETTKCRIYTPIHGILKRNSILPFHCLIPGATSILVTVDSKQISSTGYNDPVFKQEITVGSTDVTIDAIYGDNNYSTSLIQYSVQ